MPRTLFDKIWEAHEVAPGLLYVDLHLVHEVTSPQAFDGLRLAGRTVRRPDRHDVDGRGAGHESAPAGPRLTAAAEHHARAGPADPGTDTDRER